MIQDMNMVFLGDYALALGDGYLIHGTIYKRFLGMPVTHGCVRLNDEDLEGGLSIHLILVQKFIFSDLIEKVIWKLKYNKKPHEK